MIYFTETSKKTPVSQYYQGHEEPGQALKLVTFGPPPYPNNRKWLIQFCLQWKNGGRREKQIYQNHPPPPRIIPVLRGTILTLLPFSSSLPVRCVPFFVLVYLWYDWLVSFQGWMCWIKHDMLILCEELLGWLLCHAGTVEQLSL